MRFEGKVAVVSGATSGIGQATALGLAGEGARVAAIGRNADVLASLEAGGLRAYRADLSDETARTETVARILEDFGGVDVLVNAAGIIASGSIETTTLDAYDEMMNINVRAVLHMSQLCLDSIVERKGNIVNVSSVTGLRAFPGVLAYCISKSAVDQFTRCAALELAPRGVRVNAVNPGVVGTNLHRRSGMDDTTYDAFTERSKSTHPLGRIGTPGEIRDLIMFLASDQAGWITGVTYSIDGGRAETCAR
jgi:NAD(P)-dependent dehydrogenase (short-subunit alcohol dehydrogenase family)